MAALVDVELPVFLRVGQGEECNVGSICVRACADAAGVVSPAAPDIAAFLREVATYHEEAQASHEQAQASGL